MSRARDRADGLALLTDAKGDLIVASAADTVGRLAIGSNDQALTADSAESLGMKWANVGTREAVPTIALSANVETLDLAVSNCSYITTAPTANWTLNVTNAPTTEDKAITVTVFCTQDATGYYPSTFQVAGSGQTIKWQGGTAPTPTSTAGKIDIFSFTMVRKSAAWVVFGSALLAF